MSTVVSSFIAAIVIAAFFAILKTRWLYVVLPKSHLNTPFSKGHVALLTFHSHGFRTEESIEFLIRTTCRCELLATSKANVTLVDNKLTISRITRFQSITVVLLAEGKPLEKDDIDTFESKETVGKIVEKKEQLNSVAQQLIVWPLLLLLLGLPFAVGTYFGKHQQQNVFEIASELVETQPIPITGFKLERGNLRNLLQEPFAKELKSAGFPATITAVGRRGSQLIIEVSVANPFKRELEISFTGKSAAGDTEVMSFTKRHVSDFIVFPNEVKRKSIEIFLPESFENKIFFVDFRIDIAGASASLTDRVSLGK